jgi:putative oxidoreductase
MSSGLGERVLAMRDGVASRLDKLRDLALLLGRLGVGLVFLSTGWGKVHNVEKVTEFFTALHIPAPGFHAVLVGWSELLCGLALVVGLFTRLATAPLIVSMIVAIVTAKRGDIHGFFDLVAFEEFTYLVLLVMIAILGPGAIALDHLLPERFRPAKPKPKRAPAM